MTIAINDALKYRHREDLDSELATIEHLWIELKTNAESILVCCAYRPPNVSSKHFLDDYNQLITCGEKSNKEMIITMDSNLDLHKSSSHSHTQLFLENNIIKNIYPCISKPTCVTHSMAMLIDNIWCSEKLHRDKCSYVIVDEISDHYTCMTILPELKEILKIEKFVFIRPIKDQNIKEIRHELTTEK